MRFNYSYRAFLLTSLLLGGLVLILYSIKLKSGAPQNDEITYDVELAEEDDFLEEEQLEEILQQTQIETHKAYNEAEKFLSASRKATTSEDLDKKLAEIDEAISKVEQTKIGVAPPQPKKSDNKPQDKANSKDISHQEDEGSNRRTTISYRLKNRKDIDLPNPVYTCSGSGKIVITIEVNARGDVKKCSFNKNASTTNDQCLIDAALEYAAKAKFTADTSRKNQLGTITFNFPGQ